MLNLKYQILSLCVTCLKAIDKFKSLKVELWEYIQYNKDVFFFTVI